MIKITHTLREAKTRKMVRRHRRGSILIYSFYVMIVMFAMVSLGMDFGHMQSVKTELQRDCDATARSALQMYITYGSGTAVAYAPLLAGNSYNPVDVYSGTPPTVVITWGSWNSATKVFTAGGTSPVAVKVVISRTTATGNPVKLTFPLMNGLSEIRQTCDVWAQAIAVLDTANSASASVSGLSDPWLAGMPNGSPAVSDGDTAPAESPQMFMSVTPGTVLTFTSSSGGAIQGGVTHDPSDPDDGADGNAGQMHNHNDDDPMGEPAVQNNIGDIRAPIDSLIGLFLTNNVPTSQAAPTVVRDYTTQAARDQASFSDIQNQQPFFIGDGQTSGGTTQTFVVPQGATRLYLGTMDGHQWSNNSGSFAVTTTQQSAILLVK